MVAVPPSGGGEENDFGVKKQVRQRRLASSENAAAAASVVVGLLLLLSGDVELNPGPRGVPGGKPDKNKIMQDKLEAHEAKFKELEEVINDQKNLIQTLKDQQVQLQKESQETKVRPSYYL